MFMDTMQNATLLPTEQTLYEPSLIRNENYDGTRPLAIPKVNLQYLTIGDFLWRSFILFRCEAFYEIRKHIEDTVKRMQPEWHSKNARTHFTGSSRLACSVERPAIVEVVPPKVGQRVPAEVRADGRPRRRQHGSSRSDGVGVSPKWTMSSIWLVSRLPTAREC